MKSARAARVDRQTNVLDQLVYQPFSGQELESAVRGCVVDDEHPLATRGLRSNRLEASGEKVFAVEGHDDCGNTTHAELSIKRVEDVTKPTARLNYW
jgi:hypothetical protein